MRMFLAQVMIGAACLAATACTLPASNVPGDKDQIPASQGDGVIEKYWKLVELNGQPVAPLEREPYFILKADNARVIGFGGCNSLTGSYVLDRKTARIRFTEVASTMMACMQGMEVEQAFHQVLRIVDNYSQDGDRLSLNRARMAPLARFEAVYLR